MKNLLTEFAKLPCPVLKTKFCFRTGKAPPNLVRLREMKKFLEVTKRPSFGLALTSYGA
jgi:hypothetical protein